MIRVVVEPARGTARGGHRDRYDDRYGRRGGGGRYNDKYVLLKFIHKTGRDVCMTASELIEVMYSPFYFSCLFISFSI